MNRDRLLADAKAKALALAEGYQPPDRRRSPPARPDRQVALDWPWTALPGSARPRRTIRWWRALWPSVLTGGDADLTETLGEDDLLALERRAFMQLVRQPRHLARIEHMLETGKPLRN